MATKRKTKAEKAETVFNKFYGNKTRKEIIAKFTGKSVGLSEAGAATYYQNLKRKADESAAA